MVKQKTNVSLRDILGDDLLKDLFLYLYDDEKEIILKVLELKSNGFLEANTSKIKGQEYLIYSIQLSDDIINRLMERGIKGIVYKDSRKQKVYINVYKANKDQYENLNTSQYRKYKLTNGFILFSEDVYFK